MSIDYKACANAIMMIGKAYCSTEEAEAASDALAELLRGLTPLTPERAIEEFHENIELLKKHYRDSGA